MAASETAVAILQFGRFLHVRDRDPAKLEQAELQLLGVLRRERSASLKQILNFNAGKPVEPVALRVLAHVAYLSLCGSRFGTTVGDVLKAVAGDDPATVLETRQAISSMLITKKLMLENNRYLELGKPVLDYLAGGKDALPLTLTEYDLQMEWRKAEVEAAKRRAKMPVAFDNLPTAKQLAERIAKHVVGSEAEVRTIACRLAMHIRRGAMIKAGNDPGSPNEALLFIGPSGCGKTYLAETAGRVCDLPFGSISSADLTAEGYVGMSVDDAVKQVLVAANYDVDRARYGICFFDEFDKKRSAGWDFGSRDIGGAAVQQAVLRLMEGTQHQIGGRKGSYDWAPTTIDTKATCFIFAGAFSGLERVVRRTSGTGIGFGKMLDATKQEGALYASLEEYGMIPEFINRLTGLVVFAEPSLQQLISIAERSIIPSYNRMLAPGGAEIQVTEDAVRFIADCAKESRTYARGIKSVLSRLVEGIVYEQATGTVTITETEVREVIGAIGLVEKRDESVVQVTGGD